MTCEGESPVRLEELLAGKSYPSRFEQKTPIGFFTLAFLYAIPIPFFNKSERERENFPLPKMAMTIEGTNSLAPLDHAHNSLILLLLWFQFFLFSKLNWILGFWLLIISGIMEDRLIFVGY